MWCYRVFSEVHRRKKPVLVSAKAQKDEYRSGLQILGLVAILGKHGPFFQFRCLQVDSRSDVSGGDVRLVGLRLGVTKVPCRQPTTKRGLHLTRAQRVHERAGFADQSSLH